MLKSCFSTGLIEAGCDEAGRGCLAGPVVAAAVILPPDYSHELLNDSKQLSRERREQIREDILRDAVSWAVAEVSNHEIDRMNILNASFLAMHRALDELKVVPELILVDGNRFKVYRSVQHECIVKGDGKYMSIAAASILAKTHRDDLMCALAGSHPVYCWDKNVGYPTSEHRDAIKKYGITSHHRKSFRLLPQPELFD